MRDWLTESDERLRAAGRGHIHEPAVVDQALSEHLRGVARQQSHILHRLVAPQIAHGRGDIADRAEVRTTGRFALHRDGNSGDGLHDGAFVRTVFRRTHGALLERGQTAHRGHRPHHRRQHLGKHLLVGKLHRRIRETTSTVAARDGFGAQILVGMDAARSAYWRSYGGEPGLTWLLERFFPEMVAEGFPEDAVRRILVDNPARAYARFPRSGDQLAG